MNKLKDDLKTMLRPISKILTYNKVRIVVCHRFGDENMYNRHSSKLFRRQCEYMKKNFNIISLSKYVNHIIKQIPIPSNSLIVTMDDGYNDNYIYAYPILKEFEIPATIFLVTGFINKELWFWWDKIRYIFFKSKKSQYIYEYNGEIKEFKLNTIEEREHAWDYITIVLLYEPNEVREQFIMQLQKDLDIIVPFESVEEFMPVTWDEVREMRKNGIEFGSHTHTHPILSHILNHQKKEEIEKSKQILEEKIQTQVISFSYPNGQKKDYDEESVKLVEDAGYQCAMVAFQGFNDLKTNPFEIRRVNLTPNFDDLVNKINGIEYLGENLRSSIK